MLPKLQLLGFPKTQEQVEAEHAQYTVDMEWIEARTERMKLRQKLWRERHILSVERWQARSEFLRKQVDDWTQIDRQRIYNLLMLLVGAVLVAVFLLLLVIPVQWTIEYIMRPKPTIITPDYVATYYYIDESTLQSEELEFYAVSRKEWGEDDRLSRHYATYDEAQAERDRLAALAPEGDFYVYAADGTTSCWRVMQPVEWRGDVQVSDCYPTYAEALMEWTKLEDEFRRTGSPAIDPTPVAPESIPPETPSHRSQPPSPASGAHPTE